MWVEEQNVFTLSVCTIGVEAKDAAMGVPKPTEMFIRDLLQEEFRKRALGAWFWDDETRRILDYFYPALASEIQQLKTLMQG